MDLKIKFSLYFTNHLNKTLKIDDKIVNVEDGIFEISNKKIYSTLTFVTNGVYYKPDILGDNKERMKVKYEYQDEIFEELFVIDSIEYLQNNNIKVYCKTHTYKYTKTKLSKLIQTTSISELITKLLPDIELNFDNFTDIALVFDYEINDKSVDEVINDLSKITDFDYYFYLGTLYIENKKTIKEDDTSIQRFTALKDITEFSTTTNKDENKINKLFINEKDDNIIAEPIVNLDIKDTPQCCSPDEVVYYTDDNGDNYKISPVNAFYIVYYSPLTTKPIINMNASEGERVVIENYKLENDNFVRLISGISEIIAVEGVENYSFEKGYNVLVFDYVEKGELKITYKTKVLYGTIEHSKTPKTINITIKHFNQIINYDHKIELNGYYPIPYDFTLNLVSDWGLDYVEAINKSVTISKKSGDVFVKIDDFESDSFGELKFNIEKYNTYKFETENQEPLYLDWYVNDKKIYMDEVQ